MSDTPRTDNLYQQYIECAPLGSRFEPTALCRQLERELNACKRQLEIINCIASPDGRRTMDDMITALDTIVDHARSALAIGPDTLQG